LEFISFILRDFSLSSRAFYLENGHATIPCDKKPKNLSETSYENKQKKLKTQVINLSLEFISLILRDLALSFHVFLLEKDF